MNACIFMHVLCIAFAVKYKFHFLARYLKVIVDLRRKGRSEFWAWFLPRFPDFYPADMRLFCIGFSWPPSIFFFLKYVSNSPWVYSLCSFQSFRANVFMYET